MSDTTIALFTATLDLAASWRAQTVRFEPSSREISDQVNIHGEIAAAGAGLVPRCDVGEVAEALCVLLADAPRRHAMGAAGRALVQRQWTWDVVASLLTAEYETIIARHRDARSTRGE